MRVMWSEEDKAYITTSSEFPSIKTHGETEADALDEMKSVLKDIVGGAKEAMGQFIQLNEEGEKI